jgi:diguanylate cyclase (GGDEF)-like protein/PAS domain S-box-containing protein
MVARKVGRRGTDDAAGRPDGSKPKPRRPKGVQGSDLPLDLVLMAHPGPVLLAGGDGVILYANESAQSIVLGGPGELRGRPLAEILEAGEEGGLLGALSSTAGGDPPPGPVPFRVARGDRDLRGLWRAALVAVGPASDRRCVAIFLSPEEAGGPLPGFASDLLRAVEQVDENVAITDREGRFVYVNPAFERHTGWQRPEVLGKTPRIFKSGRHPEEFYRAMWGILLSGSSFRGIVLNRRKDGTLYYEEKTITPVRDGEGTITHFVATGVDVTQRTLAQQSLKASADRYALSASATQDGLWDWEIATGKLFLSPKGKAMLGYGEGELGDTPGAWFGLVHGEDRPAFEALVTAHLRGETPRLESDHRMRTKDGRVIWVAVKGLAQRDARGRPQRMAGVQTDITVRKVEELKHEEGAMHDALTNLPNRLLFMDRLEQALQRSRRNPDDHFAVLFMDLDRFKIINDGLGHLAGDQLLMEVANRLMEGRRSSDTVARLGGDEFAMIAGDIRSEFEAMAFAERILSHFSRPFRLEGRDVFTSGSIGIALSDPSHTSPSDMVRDADTAMYHAKNRGRSRAAVFDDAMRSKAMETLEMETDLRLAVETGRIGVHYQPIVSLSTGRVAGFESLARWLHPKRGYVSPALFVPLAEECGLIHPMGRFILREACRRLKHFQTRFFSKPALVMSVNLSGVQFLRPDLLNQIDMVLREFGINPRDLKLEITESVIIEHAEHALMMIDQFKAQNIRLSIDDFGTGYSSMANLRKLPIDTVKVDQSFVRRMTEDPDSLEIVRATVTMAHNLGMDVIAEGVETAEEARLLRGMKCEYGQGYYFSKPVDAEAAESLLTKGWLW